MRKLAAIILLSILANFAMSQNINEDIKEIRKNFQWVNSQKDFKKAELNNQDFLDHPSDNGATMTGYFKNGKLYKIVEVIGISHALYRTEYYFWSNELFFVFRTEREYKSIMDENGLFVKLDYTKTDLKYQDRQYFKNGKRIRRIEKGELISSKENYPKDFVKLANKRKSLIQNRYKYNDKYNMVQGTWVDGKSKFEIEGLVLTEYYDGKFFESSRIKFEDNDFYIQSFEDNSITQYELTKLTKDTFAYFYYESSTDFVYKRK